MNILSSKRFGKNDYNTIFTNKNVSWFVYFFEIKVLKIKGIEGEALNFIIIFITNNFRSGKT